MNSIWNSNISQFKKRFPELCRIVCERNEHHTEKLLTLEAKTGALTALENGTPLHSKYNPLREAQQLIENFPKTKTCAAFFSFGLGYAPIEFAKKFPTLPLVIAEPDLDFVIDALNAIDWTPLFTHAQIVFAFGATEKETASLLERYGIKNVQIYESANQAFHARQYYQELHGLIERTKQKDVVNTNTLEKFAKLWLRNSCKNLSRMADCDGVKKFMNTKPDIPFIILAAGPSLQTVLPHLAQLKKRSIIVCVDTALHSCLKAGVEPDFIVLVDPQQACARHLDFLKSPSSILITESAAWPSVFRFPCKEIVLCSSLFPLGKYFEKQLGEKGKLGAGGSVTTTAWDFAYSTGAKEIYIAGMDLGFPQKQTHIRGSQFEERAHRLSKRTSPAETDGVSSLMSANPKIALDYNGKELLTDERMTLFSWWFEENCTKAKTNHCTTFTLTPQSLAISAIEKSDVTQLLSRPQATEKRNAFFESAKKNSEEKSKAEYKKEFLKTLEQFKKHMEELSELSRKGIRLCDTAIKDRSASTSVFTKLDILDKEILCSDAKDAAALVFPTQRQLEKKSTELPQEPVLHQLYYSRLIYTELLGSISQYKKYL